MKNSTHKSEYSSVSPCLTCTKQSRAEQKLMPRKQEQESAFFEWPLWAQATNTPQSCRLEQHFSSFWGGSNCFCGSGRHPSSILRFRADSSGTHRAFCGSGAVPIGPFEHSALLGRARAVHLDPAAAGSWAGSSGHFELAAAPVRARVATSTHLRLRARLEQPNAANKPGRRRL